MRRALPTIVIAQFFCTSLWFAGNAIVSDIITDLQLAPSFLAHLTSAVQFGFIMGTLVFAVFTISDRFSPSLVFCISAIIAALFNLGICFPGVNANGLLTFRFLTGFFLAGIYPVGMKIASDHYQKGLGKSLGFLVGALVLGTALPHLLKNFTVDLPWRYVLFSTSVLSVIGGLSIVFLVPNGPHQKQSQQVSITAFIQGFSHADFRSASFGYFGHMWELYSFWAFVPVMLSTYHSLYPTIEMNVQMLSFFIIASGGLACVISGLLGQYFGAKKVATISLFLSFLCCVGSPLFVVNSSPVLLLVFLFFWGLVVIADSPLFSTLVSHYAPTESRGTSLTIVNCIGFSITIISIQLLNFLSTHVNAQYLYTVLAIGPLLGLVALIKEKYSPSNN